MSNHCLLALSLSVSLPGFHVAGFFAGYRMGHDRIRLFGTPSFGQQSHKLLALEPEVPDRLVNRVDCKGNRTKRFELISRHQTAPRPECRAIVR